MRTWLIFKQMKGMWMKICAVLLVIWYCMSIIGFDVHTCKGSGRTFVATFAEGMTCADIHPEHHCGESCHGHSSCCHHISSCCHDEASCCSHDSDCSHDESFSPQDCCTDSYQSILLTGFRAEDDHRHYDECHCGGCPCIIYEFLNSLAYKDLKSCHSSYNIPDRRGGVPCDLQAEFGVWRI